jgi:hypothetical protein
MEAFEKRAQFRGNTDEEQAAWLRTMLARNAADMFRAEGRLKRDMERERSLDEELDNSSARLGRWLAADQPSPSEHARPHEQAILVADALARLPELQLASRCRCQKPFGRGASPRDGGSATGRALLASGAQAVVTGWRWVCDWKRLDTRAVRAPPHQAGR